MKKKTLFATLAAVVLLAGCCSIERTGEYYVATKTMTFGKMDEHCREMGDPDYKPLPFSIGFGVKDDERKIQYLPPSAGVFLGFAGFIAEDFPVFAPVFVPAGAVVWAGEALVLAPVWDTLCLPVDLARRDDYLRRQEAITPRDGSGGENQEKDSENDLF